MLKLLPTIPIAVVLRRSNKKRLNEDELNKNLTKVVVVVLWCKKRDTTAAAAATAPPVLHSSISAGLGDAN